MDDKSLKCHPNNPNPQILRIGIDLMGGDAPPVELFRALIAASKELAPKVSLVAFATPTLATSLQELKAESDAQIRIYFAEEVIAMEDRPLIALRRKRHSTMRLAFQQLDQREIHALISVANTGALVAGASLFLPPIPTIDRPALLACLPTECDPVVLLDVGGNLATRPEHLLQFAQLGAAFYSANFGTRSPVKIGLLNIGKETGKGGEERQSTFALLKEKLALPLQFLGNVEPQDVFSGDVDVVVTDGFSGNIFLKAAEGIASSIFRQVIPKLSSVHSQEIKQLQQRFHSVESPGAVLCGIDRLVIKCHGSSTSQALYYAIHQTYEALNRDLIHKIKHSLSQETL